MTDAAIAPAGPGQQAAFRAATFADALRFFAPEVSP